MSEARHSPSSIAARPFQARGVPKITTGRALIRKLPLRGPLLSPARSEDILQRQLEDARIHARRRDLSEVTRREVRQSVDGALAVVRVRELRVVEGIEKLRPELDRLPLPDAGRLQNRKIEIELARPKDDARSAVAVERAARDSGVGSGALRLAGSGCGGVVDRARRRHRRRSHKRRFVEPAWTAAGAA